MKTQDQRIEQLEQQQKEILDLLNKMLDSLTFSEDTEVCINTRKGVYHENGYDLNLVEPCVCID